MHVIAFPAFLSSCMRIARKMEQKTWFVQLVYKGRLGPLDVDVAVDDLSEINDFISNGHGQRAIVSIKVERFEGQPAKSIEDLDEEFEREAHKGQSGDAVI